VLNVENQSSKKHLAELDASALKSADVNGGKKIKINKPKVKKPHINSFAIGVVVSLILTVTKTGSTVVTIATQKISMGGTNKWSIK